jgi:hypothetical protein
MQTRVASTLSTGAIRAVRVEKGGCHDGLVAEKLGVGECGNGFSTAGCVFPTAARLDGFLFPGHVMQI